MHVIAILFLKNILFFIVDLRQYRLQYGID